MSDAMALVSVGTTDFGALRGLTDAFRAAGLPVVHMVDTTALAADATAPSSLLDVELLEAGGVQTVRRGEMAMALATGGAFDATPLDALLRGLGVDTVVVGGSIPSSRVSASVTAAELRGYRVLLATEELALTLGAYLRAA
ncbi:MAG: isochorismatase family protein [Acidimicrobiia bacterium]|nr:isochorismatase family protein [Acidimicrobiia bacterium]